MGVMATAIADSGRRRASPDSATHVQAEGATGSRATVNVRGIVQAVLRAGSEAADAPRVTAGALAAADVGRNEAVRSPISL
jgi:hypothetical protein